MSDDEPRMIDTRKIAGIAELAGLFMVGKTTVSNWYARRDRNGFPEAIAILASATLWDLDEVVKWYISYHPLKGGRPGSTPRKLDGTYAPASR